MRGLTPCRQWLCGALTYHGGDGGMLKTENGRMSTYCPDCGYVSPGVTVTSERLDTTPRIRIPWGPYIMLLQWARGKT